MTGRRVVGTVVLTVWNHGDQHQSDRHYSDEHYRRGRGGSMRIRVTESNKTPARHLLRPFAALCALALIVGACSASEDSAESSQTATSEALVSDADGENSTTGEPAATAEPVSTPGAEPLATVAPPPTPSIDSAALDRDNDGSGNESSPDSARRGAAGKTGCKATGLDFADDIQIEIRAQSPSDRIDDVIVVYELFEDDVHLGEGQALMQMMLPGEMTAVSHDTLTSPDDTGATIECEIVSLDSVGRSLIDADKIAGRTCDVVEVDGFGDVQIAVAFEIQDSLGPAIEAVYSLRFNDVRFGSGSLILRRLLSGERVRLEVDTLTALPPGVAEDDVECAIVGLAVDDSASRLVAPSTADRCAVTEVDSYGDVQLRAEVTNPLGDDEFGPTFAWALWGPDATRVAEGDWFPDGEGPGTGPLSIDFDTFTALPAGIDVDDLSCEILGWIDY